MGRRQVIAWVVLGLLQALVVLTLALAGPDDTPHGAPIRIVAPPVVATSLVESTNAAAGEPFHAEGLATAGRARESIRTGRSVAAVVVDLRTLRDVLYVASANGTDLNRAIAREVRLVEGTYGRQIEVRDLVPVRDDDARHIWVYALTGTAMLLGLVMAIVITWLRGPRAETLRGGVRRQLVNAGSAMVAGGLLAVVAALHHDTDWVTWWLISTFTILATAATTMALESLFGVVGIGVATTLFVLAAAPLVSLVHPLLLPQPWAAITPWLPHGAALEAATSQAYFGGEQVVRPLLVLTAWYVTSLLTTIVSRREMGRDAAQARRLRASSPT